MKFQYEVPPALENEHDCLEKGKNGAITLKTYLLLKKWVIFQPAHGSFPGGGGGVKIYMITLTWPGI